MKYAHHIRQIQIDSAEALESQIFKTFAQDCHTVIEPKFPLYFVLVDGIPSAFYYASRQVCIYPTVHPSWISPRAFYEAARSIVKATRDKFGNPVWLIDSHSSLNDPFRLKKVGLEAKALAVYEPERVQASP